MSKDSEKKRISLSDLLSGLSLIAALSAVFISIWSYNGNKELSEVAFERNYRPILMVNNFAYLNSKSLMIQVMRAVIVFDLNSPAYIKSSTVDYCVRYNGKDSLIFHDSGFDNTVAYPNEKQQMTEVADSTIINDSIANKLLPKVLVRKIYFTYTWIDNSDKLYYFSYDAQYDSIKKCWNTISQSAN